METLPLDVKSRDTNMKAKVLLREDIIPIQFYGKGIKSRSFQVDYQTFRKLYRIAGSNTIVELNVDGKEKVNTLVHEVQTDPVTDLITHIDMINVRMDQEIMAKIPLKFVGVSKAVKDEGGILTPHINEIEVKCLPANLIHEIEVSVEPLVDFNTYIRVKDLTVPGTLTVLNEPGDVVINAVLPRAEEEVVPVAAAVAEEGAEPGTEGAAKEGEAGAGAGGAGAGAKAYAGADGAQKKE